MTLLKNNKIRYNKNFPRNQKGYPIIKLNSPTTQKKKQLKFS